MLESLVCCDPANAAAYTGAQGWTDPCKRRMVGFSKVSG